MSRTDNIRAAFFLNLGFTIIEIVGGIYTNSIAIIADALHDLGDSFSLGLSWALERVAGKKRTKRYTYGYARYSLLAGLINALTLVVGSVFVLMEAVPRLLSPEPSNAPGMAFLAVLGIAVNGAAVLRLKRGKSLNEEIVSWHLLEDVLGWCAILIVAIINMFTSLPILDPALAILFTIVIMINVLRNLRKVSSVFLQGVPGGLDMQGIEKAIRNSKHVVDVHDIHAWSMDADYCIMTLHVVVEKDADSQAIFRAKCYVKEKLKAHGIDHATIEMEKEDETCDFIGC